MKIQVSQTYFTKSWQNAAGLSPLRPKKKYMILQKIEQKSYKTEKEMPCVNVVQLHLHSAGFGLSHKPKYLLAVTGLKGHV